MSASKRVFVTGLSALTACGENVEQTWESVLAGETGIAEITQWDLSSWPSRLGGELKNFQPAKMLPDRKLIKVISRHDAMGINAAMQAVNHSQMISYRDSLDDATVFNDETAVFVGSPGNKYFQQDDFLPLLAKTGGDMRAFADELFNEVHPTWLLRILPNNVLAYTGISYGFKGPNHNITNHAVSGTQAILEAYQAIRSGQAERAVVVAYDLIEPQSLFYYDKLGVLSATGLKPFDSAHDGTILAEGAAAFVLESEESARARGASCFAEVAGGLATTEASGLFSIEHEGAELIQLIKNTLDATDLTPEDIGILVAHANGNIKSDESEALAIQAVFGQNTVPVTGFKWATGHTICASGVLDAVLTTCALKNRCIPGIANFKQADQFSEGLNLSASHRDLLPGKAALMINRGFASMNACLVLKACD